MIYQISDITDKKYDQTNPRYNGFSSIIARLTGVTFKQNLETPFWKLVGQYKANIARVSLADCFALALTTTLKGTLLTSDHHEFDRIVPLNICSITFIR